MIGNNQFGSLSDLKHYVAAILRNPKYELKNVDDFVTLEKEHQKFIYELFSFHPKAKAKLKNLDKIKIGYNTFGQKPTRCFFIEKTTSEKEDISFLKACNSAYEVFAAQNSQCLLKEHQNV